MHNRPRPAPGAPRDARKEAAQAQRLAHGVRDQRREVGMAGSTRVAAIAIEGGEHASRRGGEPIYTPIAEIIEAAPVVVFTSSDCPYCDEAKAALTDASVDFKEVAASDWQRAQLTKRTGSRTVPQVFVGGDSSAAATTAASTRGGRAASM